MKCVEAHSQYAYMLEMVSGGSMTFDELCAQSDTDCKTVSEHLKRLCNDDLASIKTKDEKVTYALTERGLHIHGIICHMASDITKALLLKNPKLFATDAKTLWNMKDMGIPRLRKLLEGSKIVLTPSEFSSFLETNEDNGDDEEVEDFLYSDHITVPFTYENSARGVMHEVYLMRIKNLDVYEASVVATAIEHGAWLISDVKKIIMAAKSVGMTVAGSKTISLMDENRPAYKQFDELACQDAPAT